MGLVAQYQVLKQLKNFGVMLCVRHFNYCENILKVNYRKVVTST